MKPDTGSRRRISHEETLALWKQYKESGDQQVRNRLVLTFSPLVKYIVYNKIRELPARCEVDDFISCGLEALIASIDRYDPDEGRDARAVRVDPHPRRGARRAAPPGLGAALAAPLGARHRLAPATASPPTTAARRRPRSWPTRSARPPEELRTRQHEIAASDVTSLNSLVLSDDETNVERIDTIESERPRRSTPSRPR